MTQAPTPGPLMVGDYAVRLEDHPLVKAGEVHRVTEMFRGGYLGFAPPVGGEWNPVGWGKCDADGWMPWSGGENPVPGQRVQWRTRNETDRVMSVLSNNLDWTHECRRGFDPIIAFRLAPTAPVEASGSEREITIKVGDDRIGPWRIWFDPPPIGARNCDWHYQHEDDDGSRGWMSGSCATREDCLEEIITQYEERGS